MRKVNKARIIQRLASRFGLTEQQTQEFLLDETILLITNVDELLRVTLIDYQVKDIHAADQTYYTVPANKTWIVRCLVRAATAGSSAIRIENAAPYIVGGNDIYLASGTSSTTIWTGELRLMPGTTIKLTNSGNAGDVTISLSIIYEEEDAF